MEEKISLRMKTGGESCDGKGVFMLVEAVSGL